MAARVNQSAYWLDAQDHTGPARGYAPFIAPDHTYPVYRNVRSYGAVGDGVHDDADLLQNAINTDGYGGNRYRNEVTTRPALVFVPGGEYKVSKTVDLRLNTILVGDPNNPPVFKATAGFSAGSSVINGYDFATHGTGGTTSFFVAIKNIVIDTTNVDKNRSVIVLNWGLSVDKCGDTIAKKAPRAYWDRNRPGIDNGFDRRGKLQKSLQCKILADSQCSDNNRRRCRNSKS